MSTTNESMTIEQSNKLIAEFMGIKPKLQSPDVYSWSDSPYFYCTETTHEKVMDSISKYVKYSSLWDWIMPVIEKIENMGFEFLIAKQRAYINHNTDHSTKNLLYVDNCNAKKINVCYQAVVEFIQWYNEQN